MEKLRSVNAIGFAHGAWYIAPAYKEFAETVPLGATVVIYKVRNGIAQEWTCKVFTVKNVNEGGIYLTSDRQVPSGFGTETRKEEGPFGWPSSYMEGWEIRVIATPE